MNYKELQEKAKSLGLQYIGISTEKLKTSIEEKEAEIANQNIDSSIPTPPDEEIPKIPTEDKKNDVNVAIVKNGKFEVRRFTLKDHGESFIDLANSFAQKNKYSVECIFEEKKLESETILKETNVAIVKNGKFEVRRYSLINHGKNYIELANEFAGKHDYQVEIIESEE